MPWRNVDNLTVLIGHLYTQFTQLHIEDMFYLNAWSSEEHLGCIRSGDPFLFTYA
ncbi:hypothetical protein PAXINDRAFT_21257 [Paxillus involutus ATCC 200175]|uniref:Unplaced genomic scaffold PAXINscaffold_1615, whole genome shotgun sequence n=1 Tax=Paxillus involutus ATCC 200175 TaxID=664439 RepID=A0A0C9T1T0_PAXIN|nr:hypothetical protein PAXINDRAFT_21257 [Paxillus involutus ATCC 200175]